MQGGWGKKKGMHSLVKVSGPIDAIALLRTGGHPRGRMNGWRHAHVFWGNVGIRHLCSAWFKAGTYFGGEEIGLWGWGRTFKPSFQPPPPPLVWALKLAP